MNPVNDISAGVDPDDLENNTSANPHIRDVIAQGMARRLFLKSGVGAMAVAGLGGLSACGGGGGGSGAPVVTPPATSLPEAPVEVRLGFTPVAKSLADQLVVADGYTATVVYATGDSIDPLVPDYTDDGNNANFARRAGDHHDGIHFFGLSAGGAPAPTAADRALLVMNHENIAGTVMFMHPAGQTTPRPEAEAIKEIQAHGVSVIELRKTAGRYGYVRNSTFNRRVTASTTMELRGPVRGSAFVRTRFSAAGTQTRGTINNCGHGHTPWGTYLAAEENWAGYFRRRNTDDVNRTPKEIAGLKRYGMGNSSGNNAWATVTPADPTSTEFSRWLAEVNTAAPADGTGDFRFVHNTFGYIVEIDPYDPASTPVKRTALGRRANEGAWNSRPKPGQPLAFYMGCDSRGEYVYKFVTAKAWNPADADRADRMTVGNEYMDSGTLFAARFNADGTGTWVKLDLSNPDVAAGVPASALNPAGYTFAGLADICVHSRLAADAAGATRMDRPEWTSVNPANGEVYITMTENPDRGATTTNSSNNIANPDVDPANPRYWRDTRLDNANIQRGNVNGHIVRIREDADNAGATTFRWDIFLFGAQARPDTGIDATNWAQNVNISGLSDMNDLSKPDGCWFSPTTGILWIETDDNTMTDRSNAMLLAAVPGTLGDGGPRAVVNRANGSPDTAVTTDKTVNTFVGRPMTEATFRRFLVAPKGAEITGLTESPDGRALFVNIQHPGENTASANIGNPAQFESHWPGNGAGIAAPYGPGGATARPRSATVVITRNDGGLIGT